MEDRHKGIAAVAGGSVGVFWYGAFIFGFPGVMSHDWQIKLQVGRGEIGTILCFVLAAVGIVMFFVGRWQEKVGFRGMAAIGAIIGGLDLFFIAYASKLWMLYLWAFIMGAGSCFVYAPALTSVQSWFPTRRGLVSGIVNLTFGLSGAVMAPLFRYMLKTMGYESTILSLAAVALVAGLAAARFMGGPEAKPAVVGPSRSGDSGLLAGEERYPTLRQCVLTTSFGCLWLTWALQGAAGISMVILSTAYGLSKGFDVDSAVVILMAFNLTNGVGRIVTGYASDHLGRNSTMSFTFFCAGIAYLVLPHANSLTGCSLLAMVIGFAFGTLFAVSAPLTIDCFGLKRFGAIFGLAFTAYGFFAGLIGPSLSGYLLDATAGNYGVVFGYLAAFCLVSSVLIRFVVPVKHSAPVSGEQRR